MQQDSSIRLATSDDVPILKMIIDATGVFPSSMLDKMMADYLSNPASTDVWLTAESDGLTGIAYYAPERLTEGTWNLYLLAIHPDHQGQGLGAAIMRYVEQALTKTSERVLLVETSGVPDFEYQRTFYRKCGYEQEARIRDFYSVGDDKIIFRKSLTTLHT